MEAYSKEFRRDVLAACDAGEGTRSVALRFDVSESWVRRIKQERREQGKVAPLVDAASPQGLGALCGVALGEARRASRHLSPGTAGRGPGGAWLGGLGRNPEPGLSRAASNSKKKTRPPSEQQREDVVGSAPAVGGCPTEPRSGSSRVRR